MKEKYNLVNLDTSFIESETEKYKILFNNVEHEIEVILLNNKININQVVKILKDKEVKEVIDLMFSKFGDGTFKFEIFKNDNSVVFSPKKNALYYWNSLFYFNKKIESQNNLFYDNDFFNFYKLTFDTPDKKTFKKFESEIIDILTYHHLLIMRSRNLANILGYTVYKRLFKEIFKEVRKEYENISFDLNIEEFRVYLIDNIDPTCNYKFYYDLLVKFILNDKYKDHEIKESFDNLKSYLHGKV